MATRKVKDAKDLSTDELIYFKGHAKATYMSDGTTVEDKVNGKADTTAIPTKTSQLTNDSGYITSDDLNFSSSAEDVVFNPSGTGLASTNVQDAIEEVKEALDNAVIEGGGVVVVQELGTSTKHVMSQKAVTDAIPTVVNDLTTGGADKALSAEMGKELGGKTEDNRYKISNVLNILFSISDEIKSAKIIDNRFINFGGGQVIGISTRSGWSMLSIPIVEGVDYKFRYQTTGECSWYITNSDYSTPSTIVAGRNGNALVNTTIIDETEHIASFTAPVSGLFNINFNINDYHLIDVYFTKLSDNDEYKVLGIPKSIVEDLDSLEQALQFLSDNIGTFTTEVDTFDVNLQSTGLNFIFNKYPVYIGGISENKSNSSGLLTKLKSNATVSAGTRHIRVYKKVRNSSNEVTDITTVATYEIISETDWSELDVSSLNIRVPADCAVAIEKLNADDNPAKYSKASVSESDSQRLILNGRVSYNGYCGGFTFAVRQKILDISNVPAFFNLQDIVNLHTEQIATLNENIWSNLNVCIMGDSITWLGGDDCNQDRGWTKWFKEKANPLTCKSYARSGATLTNLETTEYNITENTGSTTKDNVFYNQISRLIYAYDNGQDVAPDVLLVALGTNDFGRPRTPNAEAVFTANIDSYTTSESVQTMLSIAQALRYGVEMLYQKFPDVQIMFLTPQQSTWNTIENREGVGNEIEQSCRYLGIPCLRLDYEAATWFIRENVSHYKTYDGTHTSAMGAKRNGYLIEKWARNKLQY